MDIWGEWSTWERAAAGTAAIAAGLSGLLYILGKAVAAIRRMRTWWLEANRRLDALDRLVTHELTHNSGSSLKDASVQAAKLSRDNSRRLDAVEASLATLADAQTLIWPAIEAVAKAEPPQEGTTAWPRRT